MRRPELAALRALLLAGALALAPAATAIEAPGRLVYSADFSAGAPFDSSFWIAETGFFRNKEAQYYQPANVILEQGALVLEGRPQVALNDAYAADGADWRTTTKDANYTSGSIVSREAFTYGVFEVIARLPQSRGTWPAIWMIYEQGLPYREIDLAEAVGKSPGRIWSTIDAGPDITRLKVWQAQTPLPDLASAFHAYRLEWRKDSIAITIDGREVLRMNPEEAHQAGVDPLRAPMHLRINLALGGSWGGRIDDDALPARLEVKSVKIWSLAP